MSDLILLLLVILAAVVLFGLAVVAARPRRRPPITPRHPGEPEPYQETKDTGGTATLQAPSAEAPPAEAPPAALEAPPTAPLATPPPAVTEAPPTAPPPVVPEAPPAPPVEVLPLRERFKRRLTRSRNLLGATVADIFGRGVSDEAWGELEETLIAADVGVESSLALVEQIRRRARNEGITSAPGVIDLLKDELRRLLASADRELRRSFTDEPTVWLITGVNGTGKTTSIGKLAASETRQGRTVVLGAADTFRAAAIEQLGTWADRAGARLVTKEAGADPAAVAYDAYNAAKATDAHLLIVDTAGRLHNKRALMEELGKVKRVLENQGGPLEEVLLVLDATTGQNAIAQARAFLEAVAVSGLILTKLDGTAKGGIVIAVQRELGLPVKLVGIGEGIDDLAPFDPDAFVDALFEDTQAAA